MSWHFLQEQEAASWEASSLDGAPSALLKLMPTRAVCFSLGNVTACCLDSLFGTMCGPSMVAVGEARSTWLREDSRAKTSARQDSVLESTVPDPASGPKWPGSWAKYDPATRSWKTTRSSLLADSTEFSGTWPKWGSMLDGECLQLAMPDWITSAKGSGSLPTPSGVNGGRNHTMGRVDEWGGSSNPLRGTVIGSLCSPEFEELVMGWPVTWTAPTPLEMDRFRRWLRWHGKSWPRSPSPHD
jgi:hypothetical protein